LTGAQKTVVAALVVLAAAAFALGIAARTGSVNAAPSTAAGSTAAPHSPVPSPRVSEPPSSDKPLRLGKPESVRATVTFGKVVRVEWVAATEGVRYFKILDNSRLVGEKLGPGRRQADVTVSYGTHCLRVMAVAEDGYSDSPASACAKVTVVKPASAPPSRPCPPGYVLREGTGECILGD